MQVIFTPHSAQNIISIYIVEEIGNRKRYASDQKLISYLLDKRGGLWHGMRARDLLHIMAVKRKQAFRECACAARRPACRRLRCSLAACCPRRCRRHC